MEAGSQQQRGLDDALSSLDAVANTLELARDSVNMKPANGMFSSSVALLTTIRVSLPPTNLAHAVADAMWDSMINKANYVELGLACADLCKVLHQGMGERQVGQSVQSVLEAIERLTA